MTKNFILFDMDGVLLTHAGYHQALKYAVKKIGMALGLPASEVSGEQIAHFEALSITNEWDSLAIITALILITAWESDPAVRLGKRFTNDELLSDGTPPITDFLESFSEVGVLPARSALKKIRKDYPFLKKSQLNHLEGILFSARDIYQSPLMALYQELVLGSSTFADTYGIEPQMAIESFLTDHDKLVMTIETKQALRRWLAHEDNFAGIMTNRPSSTPSEYLSSPEAELGAKLVQMDDLPLLGSGMLAWFAVTQCKLADHTFYKPNPIHALALLQMCCGETTVAALELAYDFWRGKGDCREWEKFCGSQVMIFEDSIKGLRAGQSAQQLLKQKDIDIKLNLIGISSNSIKRSELGKITDQVYPDINQVDWGKL